MITVIGKLNLSNPICNACNAKQIKSTGVRAYRFKFMRKRNGLIFQAIGFWVHKNVPKRNSHYCFGTLVKYKKKQIDHPEETTHGHPVPNYDSPFYRNQRSINILINV